MSQMKQECPNFRNWYEKNQKNIKQEKKYIIIAKYNKNIFSSKLIVVNKHEALKINITIIMNSQAKTIQFLSSVLKTKWIMFRLPNLSTNIVCNNLSQKSTKVSFQVNL